MLKQMHSWEETERILVANELARLFALQDSRLTDEKKAIFLEELEKSRLPVGAIIQGIRGLVSEDLRTLKLNVILDAARRFVTYESRDGSCRECHDGLVLMRDGENRLFALGCTCVRGSERGRALQVKQWDGAASMMANGRLLTKW